MGEIHELFVLALSLVWLAGATLFWAHLGAHKFVTWSTQARAPILDVPGLTEFSFALNESLSQHKRIRSYLSNATLWALGWAHADLRGHTTTHASKKGSETLKTHTPQIRGVKFSEIENFPQIQIWVVNLQKSIVL